MLVLANIVHYYTKNTRERRPLQVPKAKDHRYTDDIEPMRRRTSKLVEEQGDRTLYGIIVTAT